jgi:hypothetical protein
MSNAQIELYVCEDTYPLFYFLDGIIDGGSSIINQGNFFLNALKSINVLKDLYMAINENIIIIESIGSHLLNKKDTRYDNKLIARFINLKCTNNLKSIEINNKKLIPILLGSLEHAVVYYIYDNKLYVFNSGEGLENHKKLNNMYSVVKIYDYTNIYNNSRKKMV